MFFSSSNFTGGIMQTDELVPRAPSIKLDTSTADFSIPFQQSLRISQHLQYPLESFINMAVKQEPQEEDEQARQSCVLRLIYLPAFFILRVIILDKDCN